MDTETVIDVFPNTERVCTCEYCAQGRLIHWFCDNPDCVAPGPFRFSFADPAGAPAKMPYGQRQYNNVKGLVGGIRRWCSAKCAINEEKVYLMDLLDKAQARRDLTTVRVITGRLHEMQNAQPPQIPTRTEKLTRVDDRASSLVTAQTEVDVDGKPLTD